MTMLPLLLENIPASTVTLGVVTIFTSQNVGHWFSTSAKTSGLPYQDQDGQATPKSQQEAENVFRRRAAYALVCTIAAAIQSLRNASETTISPIEVGLWLLLTVQVGSIARKTNPFDTFSDVKSALASSVCIFVYFVHKLLLDSTGRHDAVHTAAISLVTLLLLSLPRRPVVYSEGLEVLDYNGSSLLGYVLFSYGFISRKSASDLPAKLALKDVPLPHHALRAKTLQEQFARFAGAGRLWLQLLRSLLVPLSKQWNFVVIKAASELGSRHALFQLLRGLEYSGSGRETQNDTWTWVLYMGLALLSNTIADSWLYWISTGELLTPATSILQTAIYDKITRRKTAHGAPHDEKKPAVSSAGDMLFNDTNVITKAVIENYNVPLALLKILLDIVYVTNLLGLKSILVGAVFPVATIFLSKQLASHHQTLQKVHSKSLSSFTGIITETLQNLRHIRLASLEGLWSKRLASAHAEEQNMRWQANVQLQKLNVVAGLGPVLLASAAISVNALETGRLSPSVAFTALNLFGTLYEVFTQLPSKLSSIHTSFVSCQKLDEYLQQPDQVKVSVPSESIVLEQACLMWPALSDDQDEAVFKLSDVTLDFPRGNLSVITGKVGSGKSLLLAALLDEATIESGRFEKPAIQQFQDKEASLILGSTAYVSQPPWIDSSSIKDNITFGYPFNKERYDQALTACALRDDLESLRDGDNTAAGEGGASLSGGQKWRVALARAMYSPAEILILEDVLSAVDTHVASWICEHALTGKLAEGRTIILATHRPEFCTSLASYVVQVNDGTAKGSSKKSEAVKKQITKASDAEREPGLINASEKGKSTPVSEPQPATSQKPAPSVTKGTLSTLYSYILSSGISFYLFGALITVCYQGINASHSWWLARWTSAAQDGTDTHNVTVGSVCIYLILSISGTVALAIQSLVFVNIGMAAARSAFSAGVDSMLGATLGWMDRTPFGGLFQSLDNDMHILDKLIGPSLNGILGTVLQLTLIITTSYYSNPYTAIISIAVLTAFCFIGPKMIKPGQKLRPLLIPGMYPLTNHANATVLGLTTIRAFGQTQLYKDRMLKLVDTSATVGLHVQLGGCWGKIRLDLLSCVFVTSIAAAMAYNHINAATTGLTITLALQLRAALASLLGQVSMTRMGLTAAERVFSLTEIPQESSKDALSSEKAWSRNGALEVDSLVVRYNSDLPPVLKGVSFSVQPGQRLGIVGRTGAGKTSLANSLLRFVEASSGSISIDGVDISKVPLQQLRSAVGIIPQDPFLFSGTLRENLDPRASKRDQDLVVALQRVRLIVKGEEPTSPFSNLDMAIQSGGSNLSHGQRQLICLARAMVQQHSVLILDEATSSVDNATDKLVQEIIKTQFSTKTVIVVAHKLLTAAAMDIVLVMKNGEAVELGSPQELLQTKGLFWDMVNQSGQRSEIEGVVVRVDEPPNLTSAKE